MNTATKTRAQRRMEKKQALILLVLVLAVSLASFFLGAVVGRQGAERELVQKQQVAERILVTPSAESAADAAAPVAAEKDEAATAESTEQATEETKLTFYDNLAKEEAVPLGSGINLPPQAEVAKKLAVQPPIDLPDKPIVKKQVSAVAQPKLEPSAPVSVVEEATLLMPKSDPKGRYAVQVGSFAAAADAGAFKKQLSNKGYPAFVIEADLGAKGLWYRVKIGPYQDGADAKSVLTLIDKKEQIKGFISRQ